MLKISIVLTVTLIFSPLHSLASELVTVGTITVPNVPPYDEDDAFDQSRNLSGMFCPTADWCLAVSDELRGVHRLKIARGADNIPSVTYDSALDLGAPSDDFRDSHGLTGNLKEFDLEAIASGGDKVYFFGSHANKRKKGKVNPGSHLVAIASLGDLKSGAVIPTDWVNMDRLFLNDAVLGVTLNKQLQCRGLNIEGATISGESVLIGLRIPAHGTDGVDPGAYVISVPLADFTDENFAKAKRHMLPTHGAFIGIRSMEAVGDAVLVITGDAGVSDIEDPADLQCEPNLNKEDPSRPFQLRIWKPALGDLLDPDPVLTFDPVTEDGGLAKLEAIAADPGQPGAFFILHDGSDTVRYLTGLDLNR